MKYVEYNSLYLGQRFKHLRDGEWYEKLSTRPGNFIVCIPHTIGFVGHGRHGKDECCRIWSELTGGKNAGTLSQYLVNVVPEYLNTLGTEQILRRIEGADRVMASTFDRKTIIDTISDFENRHAYRPIWMAAGNWARRDDPAALIKLALKHGEITGGVRGKPEIQAGRSLLDLIVWVDRPGYPVDPTMEYGPEEADVTIRNDGSLDDLTAKLKRLWSLHEQS